MEIVWYRIESGDTLSAIVGRAYGGVDMTLIDLIVSMNPQILDPNIIMAGDMLAMPDPASLLLSGPIVPQTVPTAEIARVSSAIGKTSAEEAAMILGLTKFSAESSDAFLELTKRKLEASISPLQRMLRNYGKYKRGELTKGAYSYRRTSQIKMHTATLGAGLEDLLYNGKAPNEVLRIDLRKGTPRTINITETVSSAKKLANVAQKGIVVLKGVSLGIAVKEFYDADTNHDRARIVVEEAVSTGSQAVAAYAIGIMLVSTPVGWVGLAVIAVGTAALGYGAGKGAAALFDRYGRQLNLDTVTSVGKACAL
jgi:hypothetical protein